ncbi:MAG: GCN5-related N-acetyltransferase [Frankiales bacterium]|nr:GCN5-related N-acetyltransferase [Frankiales bacterium]
MDISLVCDRPALEAFHAIESAAHDHDYVALPADPIAELVPAIGGEEIAGELTLLYLGVRDGEPLGILALRLPTRDNLITANVDLSVHPSYRRQGVATELLDFGVAEIRRRARRRIFMEVPSRGDGTEPQAARLLRRVGAKPVLDEYRRLLDLSARPPGAPLDPPDGYRVVQWVDRCPDDLVDGVAYLVGRMSTDAPLGDMDYEPEVWDADRYRAKEASAQSRDRMRVATAVVHTKSGHVVGVTDIGVARSRPEISYQWDTIVETSHRGQRLGMVLKSWNHHYLVEMAPGVRFLNTWNASSNRFMIAVNDALGFEIVDRWTEYQLDL